MKHLASVSTLAVILIPFTSACDHKDGEARDAPAKEVAKPEGKAEPLPELDAEAAAEALASVDAGPEEARSELAIKALVKLEERRLGKSLVSGLQGVVTTPSDMRFETAAPAISENAQMFESACNADAGKTFQALDAAQPSERMDLLWSTCNLARHGLMSKDETEGADASAVILTHMAFAHLQAHGGIDPNERKLLEIAAKLPATAPTPAAE